jgi:glycosyltransferase involved in cell wall biosynthesis
VTVGSTGRESRGARAAIVVTCFDDGETLGETIASIRRGAARTELVIVNDGSTDTATLELLSELERQGVHVLHQPNEGQARAAMAGVDATSAPYVMRFDADDLLEPDAIELLATALDSVPEAAAAWGDVQTIGLTSFRIPAVPALDPWLVTYTNCIPAGGALMRRNALVEVGGWQLQEGFEDWDLWMILAERAYTGLHVPQVVYRYRRDRFGRHVSGLPRTHAHYEVLRSRHPSLFAERRENRRRSNAPMALKLAVNGVEALPFLSRLARIQLSELFTRLFWSGGFRSTARMAAQAVALRVRRA